MKKNNKQASKAKAEKILRRCYGYTRVSTNEQAEDGLSLENQKDKIQGYAKLHDMQLIDIYEDGGVSGRTMTNRTELHALLDIIKAGETFIVYSFSRLARSVIDFLNIQSILINKQCQLIIMMEGLDTSTPHGVFAATLFAALAQLESDITSQRVKDSMSIMPSQGLANGRPPYGWKSAGDQGSGFFEVEEEQKIIKYIIRYRETGVGEEPVAITTSVGGGGGGGGNKNSKSKHLTSTIAVINANFKSPSYEKIAVHLNENGFKPPKGSIKWHKEAVRRIYDRHTREGGVAVKGKKQRNVIDEEKKGEEVEEDGKNNPNNNNIDNANNNNV